MGRDFIQGVPGLGKRFALSVRLRALRARLGSCLRFASLLSGAVARRTYASMGDAANAATRVGRRARARRTIRDAGETWMMMDGG